MSWISSPALDAHPRWAALVDPVARPLGLLALPPVAHLALASCIASFALQKLSQVLSPRVFRSYYPTSRTKQDDWDLHMVGWAYAFVAAPIALHLLRNPSPQVLADPLFGAALPEQRLSAIAVGYFIWDALVTARHISTQGFGFFLHGAVCLCAFLFTLRPFVLWCGPCFLIWEVSTIFLNAHWLFDKLKMTGSVAQMVNGLFLVISYIVVRLVFGTYNSYTLWRLLVPSSSDPSFQALAVRKVGAVRWMYLVLNVAANGLNFFWFRLMVLALKKRFVPSPNASSAHKAQKKPVPVDGRLADQERRVKGE
ncbi:hypothetical protein Rhopal_000040-T1 [Rhodotorula paludigena]|uniref:TLC domain-containing protein n=1 Tax=Rhodotorula paludigena TaxID=86838 RepID=A0AAV5G4B6_9BASI|nr:hypothetical protein Rhopal_000040-T1 [Rhodotorula paludigena]